MTVRSYQTEFNVAGKQLPRFLGFAKSGACLFLWMLGLLGPTTVFADDADSEKAIDFVRDIEPILREHCHKCHGSTRQRGELRLDEKSSAMKGGESFSPAIIPGQSAISPLFRFVDGQVDG